MRSELSALLACSLALWGASVVAEPAGELQERAARHYQQHFRAILDEFGQLLAIPNHASSRSDIERNLVALEQMLHARGLATRRLGEGRASPALYAQTRQHPGRATVLFYAHYDGQPVGSGWRTSPFEPTLERDGVMAPLREALPGIAGQPGDQWRLYARSAGDDKGTIIAMLAALDALARANLPLAINLKVFLEGEEEVGSPNLADIVRANAELLKADLLLFADGPRHQSGKPQIVLGVRGIQKVDITLYGPGRTLHSGHYGNWAPNPAARLAQLLGSMRAPDGRIQIEGYYEAVDKTLADQAVKADEQLETRLLTELRLAQRESKDRSLASSIALPALNVIGLRAGDTGAAARNAIPAEASASIDLRLVPQQSPESVRRQVEAHVRKAGYLVVHTSQEVEKARERDRIALLQWDGSGYAGVRAREDNPPVRALVDLLRELHGDQLVVAPILGGSLPLSLFADNASFGAVVVLPIANYDNNQHAPNENLTLGSLRYGIETFAVLFGALRLAPR